MQRNERRWLWAVVIVGLVACSSGLAIGILLGRAPFFRLALAPTATLTMAPTAIPSIPPTPTCTLTPEPGPTREATPTVKPSPTPRPARPITKIGPEISRGTHVALGQPKVVKLRNVTRDYVAQVRQEVGANCLIIIRFFDEADTNIDPRQSAREWYGRLRGEMLAMRDAGAPNIAFETGVNEAPNEKLDWYVQYSLELIPLMHTDGLRCVAGNPAVGNWNEKDWPKFKPVIDILKADDFVGLHEYWVDTGDIDNRWHCGRWTIPEIAAVLGNTKIVITECGRDRVEGRGESGWKRTCDAEEFLWDLETYDILLNQYPNVVGAVAFTIDREWPDFDLFDIWPQVVYRYTLNPRPQP